MPLAGRLEQLAALLVLAEAAVGAQAGLVEHRRHREDRGPDAHRERERVRRPGVDLADLPVALDERAGRGRSRRRGRR